MKLVIRVNEAGDKLMLTKKKITKNDIYLDKTAFDKLRKYYDFYDILILLTRNRINKLKG